MNKEFIFNFVAEFWVDLLRVPIDKRDEMIEVIVSHVKKQTEHCNSRIMSYKLSKIDKKISKELHELKAVIISTSNRIYIRENVSTELWYENNKLQLVYLKDNKYKTLKEV